MASDHYQPLRGEYAVLAHRYDRRWARYVCAISQATLRRMRVAPGDRVLDVGCGTGFLLTEIARSEPDVKLAGVDLSAEMRGMAHRRLGVAADLRQAMAESLPFPGAAFDVVVCSSVFHFIREPEAALREMRRVLKPSGRLVLTDWCRDYLTCRLLDWYLRRTDPGHFRTYTGAELGRLIEQAGWERVAIERYRIDWFWGVMTARAEPIKGG